jgi:hypothetical protein
VGGTPAGGLVVLKTLRAQLAGMQHQVAEHGGESAATAAVIRPLGYAQHSQN